MPLDDSTVAALGTALFQARTSGVAIGPLTAAHPDMDMADAYRVQQDVVARLLAGGDRVVGYKLGLTSAPMQQMLGVDSPDFAPVLATHVNPDGADVAVQAFIWPRVEAEIALVLREDLAGPNCTAQDAARAVGGARAAIEIVDSRIQDWKIKLADTIADLASSADLWYGGGGPGQNDLFGYAGRPSFGHDSLATFWDLSADTQPIPWLGLNLYYGHAAGHDVIRSSFPDDPIGHFGYVETVVRF